VPSEEHAAGTVVGVEVVETLQWCLRFMTKLDEAEASKDLATISYSPLTHSVAQSLHTLLEYQPAHHWPPGTQDKVHQVLASMVVLTPTVVVSPRSYGTS
jgi:hypothetical protein